MSCELKTLGTVAQYINGRAFKPDEWEEKGIPIIRIQNLNNTNGKYNYSSKTYEDKYLIQRGDLLFAWSASLGAHIWKGDSAWLNQHIFKVIPNIGVDRDYLYYYLLKVVAELYQKAHGTGMVHITKKPFMATPIPVPEYKKQKQIVKQIEEQMSQLDSAVETLKKTKQQLEVYRLSVLKDVFMSSSPMIPFKAITESRLGKMLDKEKNTGIMRKYLRNINVRWFGFDLSDLLEMRIEDKETEKYSIKKGDLVICEGGEPGRCAVWESNDTMYYQKALHRVRFTDGSNPKYYMYYLWFINRTGALSVFLTGTGIKHLTGQSLAKVPVPSVSVQQQNEAVSYIEDRFYSIDQVDKIINQSLQQAEALRQSILKQAFEGE